MPPFHLRNRCTVFNASQQNGRTAVSWQGARANQGTRGTLFCPFDVPERGKTRPSIAVAAAGGWKKLCGRRLWTEPMSSWRWPCPDRELWQKSSFGGENNACIVTVTSRTAVLTGIFMLSYISNSRTSISHNHYCYFMTHFLLVFFWVKSIPETRCCNGFSHKHNKHPTILLTCQDKNLMAAVQSILCIYSNSSSLLMWDV